MLHHSEMVATRIGLVAAIFHGVGADVDLPVDCCPNYRNLTSMANTSPELAIQELMKSPLFLERPVLEPPRSSSPNSDGLPIVIQHGFLDSCFGGFNMGLVAGASKKMGVYATCIPTADNYQQDFLDSVLVSLDRSVDIFAEKVRADPNLQGGFNAVGISQGGILMRGYIQKYNDPPVKNFISLHGIVGGVSQYPRCFEQGEPLGLLCRALAEVLGDLAYHEAVQNHIFPANDFRDPLKAGSHAFLRTSQLADLNNEGAVNESHAANFAKTNSFIMIKALADTVVFPNDSEWWGQFADGSAYEEVLKMEDTPFYQEDSFGLKSAHEAGKLFFETTPGDHIVFSDDQFYVWLERYFSPKAAVFAV